MIDEGQDGAILPVKVGFWDRGVFGEPDGITPEFVADLAKAMSFFSFGSVLFSFGWEGGVVGLKPVNICRVTEVFDPASCVLQ